MYSDELKQQDNLLISKQGRSSSNIEKISPSQIRSFKQQRDLLEPYCTTEEKSISSNNYSADAIFDENDSDCSKIDIPDKVIDGMHMSFPRKLHNLLSRVEAEGFSDIISWQPHGRSFKLHNPKKFAQVIMKRFFKQNKLTSFQRQLNLYDFSRIASGMDRGGYYHSCFVRGSPHLCKYIMRNPVKRDNKKITSLKNDPSSYVEHRNEEHSSTDGVNREEITDYCDESTQELNRMKIKSTTSNKETKTEGIGSNCSDLPFLNLLGRYESLIDFENPLPLELNYLEPSPISGTLRYNSKDALYNAIPMIEKNACHKSA